MTKELNDYINYRLQRASDTLNDARLLAENESHKGVRIKFMSEFIKTGLFDKEYGKLFSDLFDWRQEGDYSDFVSFDKELTPPLISQSEEFIALIRKFLTTTKR